MVDYKKLYLKLFNELSDIHKQIEQIQNEVEERIISQQENIVKFDSKNRDHQK